MKTFVIIGNNVVQDTFIKAGLYTFNATIKSHQSTHRIGFKGASGWVDVELPTNPNKFTKAHAIFELKEDVTQISLCRNGASTTNPIIVQTPMWTEGNNISTPSPNPADLDETTNNVDIKLSTQILQTNEKIQLIATEEQFNELGQGEVTAFGMIKVMAGDIELKVSRDGIISAINLSPEEIQISADRIRFTGSVEFENAVKNISPEAIRVELGIPFYEFKKENGVTISEELIVPVNVFKGNQKINILSSDIKKISSPNGIIVIDLIGKYNVISIIAQPSLIANGTVVLRVPVLGKYYNVDFNFKVVEKPKDGKDGKDGKSPYIGENGNWWVWNGTAFVDSGDKAKGDDGKSPEIRNGYWWAWDGTKWYNTGVKAKGEDGQSPKLYSLLPSTTEIHKNKNGVYSPSTISCKLIRNDENGHITLSAIPSGYRVWRQIDNGTSQTYTLGATTNTSTISKTISYWIEQISPTTTIDRKDIMVINDGTDGTDGVDGKGISIKGSVDNYNQLLGLTGLSSGDAYFNKSDGKLYIWDGFNFPPNGQGILFQGEPGKDGEDGLDGVSISSLIQQYINHDSKTVQPAQNADWLDVMPKYEDGLYMWSRFKMTLSNGQVQYSSYSLLEDFEAMMDSARIKNLIIYGDFSGVMKEIKSSNPVNYYPLGWKVSGLSHDSNGVPSDQNNIAPKIIKINTGLPKGMLAGLRVTPKTNLQGIYQNLSSNLVLNEVHTAYVFARKRNTSSVAQIRLKYGSIAITEDLTTTWARYVLKFTPTSQRPFEILFNKTGTWTANDEVEISKIQLAQTELIFDYRQFSYVENAFKGSTSIEGGVVATNMVILNNEGGEIRSYVSGIDANPYAFAAGVSGFGTDLEKRNIGIKHDGTLVAKNADIQGKVSASSGKIGVLNVSSDGVVSTDDFIVDKEGKVYMQGATMEGQILPFSALKENFSKNTYSIVWDSVTPGFNGNINLPTPVSDTNKRGGMSYVIVNLHPNNGVLTVNATGGYKIYDIIKSPASSITINKGSYVEIIGVGSENGFYGWFIKLNSPYNLG